MFLLSLALLWTLIHLAHRRLPRPSAGASTTVTLTSPVSLHLATSALNALPVRLLGWASRRESYWKADGRRWRVFLDVGAVAGVAGVALGQAVLLWSAARAVAAAWAVWTAGGAGEGPGGGLMKRGWTGGGARGGSDGLVLHAVIPGLTTPLSALPLLTLALFTAQSFHELGHALAAAAEAIPILATGLHVHLVLPTAYVALPSTVRASHGPVTELRIATAGIVHNVVLCAVVGVVWQAGVAGVGKGVWGREAEGGVVVVGVDRTSALYSHLPVGALITSLDDLELDSSAHPLNLWHDHLASPTQTSDYSSLGWCLPSTSFSPQPTACCLTPSTSPAPVAAAALSEHRLCFAHIEDGSTACLPALPLFPPSTVVPTRCLTDVSCEGGAGCARIAESEKVVRVGVQGTAGAVERTVIWQGERRGVLGQVTVTDTTPRLGLVPVWLPHTLATLASHIFSLSLSLAFLNLLPLPRLDGSAILSALRDSLAGSSPGPAALNALESGAEMDEGVLSHALDVLRTWGVVQGWLRVGEAAERALTRWTVGVGGVLVACTMAVSLAGQG